jgi:hypothetical protein
MPQREALRVVHVSPRCHCAYQRKLLRLRTTLPPGENMQALGCCGNFGTLEAVLDRAQQHCATTHHQAT